MERLITIEISEPGVHTCYLQLRKRPFYQSRMMIGAALLLTSAVCFPNAIILTTTTICGKTNWTRIHPYWRSLIGEPKILDIWE